jgi:hypothetical protein
MTEETQEVVVEEVPADELSTWGHGGRRPDPSGERRWGARTELRAISIGETFTVPYGDNARVVNTGTAVNPILNFYIPQGQPGTDAEVKGFSFKTDSMVVENGLITFCDTSVQGLRNIAVEVDLGDAVAKIEQGQVLLIQIHIKDMIEKLVRYSADEVKTAFERLEAKMNDEPHVVKLMSDHQVLVGRLQESVLTLTQKVADLEYKVKQLEAPK